ncbi:MAG: hypothetical protein SGJ20_16210 [Planctomycetota bacterium]|nr:hypothetical protein [Planctomycetota bacterium]
MDNSSDMASALRPVIEALERLNVRYYVGGSVAGSVHGIGRSTLDVDVAAELNSAQAVELIRSLGTAYYASESAALEAVRNGSCFNVIHLASAFKVDIFVIGRRPFEQSVLDRAVVDSVGTSDPVSARVATAEDIILLKLDWYRLSNMTSERQWNDATTIAKLNAARLDREYLKYWGETLQISHLVEQLLEKISVG